MLNVSARLLYSFNMKQIDLYLVNLHVTAVDLFVTLHDIVNVMYTYVHTYSPARVHTSYKFIH